MASVDPNLPIISIRTLREQVAGQFRQQRLIARLTSFFGVLSLILASIGLYGVTAYNAGRRVNEIGVRMALGADRGQVVALVLRGAFGLDCPWIIDRVAADVRRGAIPGQSALRLESIRSRGDFVAVVTLGLSALVASLIPALRASLISPRKHCAPSNANMPPAASSNYPCSNTTC